MKNNRIIQVKYVPCTNTRGSRISLTESRYKGTDRKTISYDYTCNSSLDGAIKYLQSIGINIVGYGEFKDAYYIFSDSWSHSHNTDGFINIKGIVEKD